MCRCQCCVVPAATMAYYLQTTGQCSTGGGSVITDQSTCEASPCDTDVDLLRLDGCASRLSGVVGALVAAGAPIARERHFWVATRRDE